MRTVVLSVVLSAAGLTACGGGGEPPSAQSPSTVTTPTTSTSSPSTGSAPTSTSTPAATTSSSVTTTSSATSSTGSPPTSSTGGAAEELGWPANWSEDDTQALEQLLNSTPEVAQQVVTPCTRAELLAWDPEGSAAELLVVYDPSNPPPGVPADACGGDLVAYYFKIEDGAVSELGAATEVPGIFPEDQEALLEEQLNRYRGAPVVALELAEPTGNAAVDIASARAATFLTPP